MKEFKICHYCGEKVKAEAIKCKHCHSMLNENLPAQDKSESRDSGFKKDARFDISENISKMVELEKKELEIKELKLIYNKKLVNFICQTIIGSVSIIIGTLELINPNIIPADLNPYIFIGFGFALLGGSKGIKLLEEKGFLT
ncbi:MAG: hypothetical protein CV087_23625 [Candidatus Brocadia sp. WS118]|nr:MAG: hypothetical protein CV087_23625 [Candidatus Brocadia sp. WS118]